MTIQQKEASPSSLAWVGKSREAIVTEEKEEPSIICKHFHDDRRLQDKILIAALQENQAKLQERSAKFFERQRIRSKRKQIKALHTQLIDFFKSYSNESIQTFFNQHQEISQELMWGKNGVLSQKRINRAVWQREMHMTEEHIQEIEAPEATMKIYQTINFLIEMALQRLAVLRQEECHHYASQRRLKQLVNVKSRHHMEVMSEKVRALEALKEKITRFMQQNPNGEKGFSVDIADLIKREEVYHILRGGERSGQTKTMIQQLSTWEEEIQISRKLRLANDRLNELIGNKNLSNSLKGLIHGQVSRAWSAEKASYLHLYEQWLLEGLREKPEFRVLNSEQEIERYLNNRVKDKPGECRLYNGFLCMGKEKIDHPILCEKFEQCMEMALHEKQGEGLAFCELETIYDTYTDWQIIRFLDIYQDYQTAIQQINENNENNEKDILDSVKVRAAICSMHVAWTEMRNQQKKLKIIQSVCPCGKTFQSDLNRYQKKVKDLQVQESVDACLNSVKSYNELRKYEKSGGDLSGQQAADRDKKKKEIEAFLYADGLAGNAGDFRAAKAVKDQLERSCSRSLASSFVNSGTFSLKKL